MTISCIFFLVKCPMNFFLFQLFVIFYFSFRLYSALSLFFLLCDLNPVWSQSILDMRK